MSKRYLPILNVPVNSSQNDRTFRHRRFRLINGLLWLFAAAPSDALAQHPVRASAEVGAFGSSSGHTPFWLRSNQYGIVPVEVTPATLRVGLLVDYDSLRLFTHRLTYGGGLTGVGNAGSRSGVLVQEAYEKVRSGIFELYAGRRREYVGLADSTLSTGSYAWSGNALPVPKLHLEIRSFTPIGLTKGFVAVKGSFANGWLGGRYVQHSLLHQKSLYVRLGKPGSRLKVYVGLNHQVVWGGRSEDLLKTGLVKNAQLPSRFRDYLSLVSGLRATGSGITDSTAYTDFDLTNRVGNHLGSVDVALELATNQFTYYLYRQNPYETGALFYGTRLADGLNGLRIRSTNPRAVVQQVVVEYLNVTNQGGSEFIISDPKRRGRVNYFNHSQYRDGWSYYGEPIGTPFIPSISNLRGKLPYGAFTNDNRVQVWHVGIAGNLSAHPHRYLAGPVTFRSNLSYSRNLGTYNEPFGQPIHQFSGVATVLVPRCWCRSPGCGVSS